MRDLCSLLLSAIITLALFPVSARAIEIIYPADKTVVLRSDFLIIKGGDKPPLEELIIDIHGEVSEPLDISSAEYKEAFADFLILEPEWDAGMNTIIVKGLVGGKVVATAKAEIYYSSFDDPAAIIPKGFQPFVLHTPEKDALCAPCHNMNPTAAELRGATAQNNPCASCHARMFNKKYVHGPEGVFQCIDCHDSSSKPQRWRVTKDELTLCGECHVDKIDDFKKNLFVHGPVATGSCVVCHDPHASDQPAQLVTSVNTLCLGCHSSVPKNGHVVRGVGGKGHPLEQGETKARPGQKLNCASCHNPHGGAGPAFFPKNITNRYTLCQECHKK
ncbi:MAG: cytochrome c3 family protein [Desulfuromonadales bacterium]|nr:cytochrome c3 family protein [Desulfuromonadales bacterium]